MSGLSNPSVARFTFSLVESTPRSRSFSMGSIKPPTSSSTSSFNSSTPSQFPTPKTLPFLLITNTFEFTISRITLQISLKTTLLELLLCKSFPIFLVLSNSCTLPIVNLHVLLFFDLPHRIHLSNRKFNTGKFIFQ